MVSNIVILNLVLVSKSKFWYRDNATGYSSTLSIFLLLHSLRDKYWPSQVFAPYVIPVTLHFPQYIFSKLTRPLMASMSSSAFLAHFCQKSGSSREMSVLFPAATKLAWGVWVKEETVPTVNLLNAFSPPFFSNYTFDLKKVLLGWPLEQAPTDTAQFDSERAWLSTGNGPSMGHQNT